MKHKVEFFIHEGKVAKRRKCESCDEYFPIMKGGHNKLYCDEGCKMVARYKRMNEREKKRSTNSIWR